MKNTFIKIALLSVALIVYVQLSRCTETTHRYKVKSDNCTYYTNDLQKDSLGTITFTIRKSDKVTIKEGYTIIERKE